MNYIILVFLTFIQTILMNYFMDLPVFDFSPYTIRLWSNYFTASLLIWVPLLFTKKRRWTYIVSILLSVWFVGNLIYFRSYGDVLNRWCLQNAGNMKGIWSSILPFLSWKDFVFPFITIIWIALSERIEQTYIFSLWKRLIIAFTSFIILCIPQIITFKKIDMPISPFDSYYADPSTGRVWYVNTYGAITHLANETYNLLLDREGEVEEVKKSEINSYIQTPDAQGEKGNLLLIIIESLEDWTIGLEIEGKAVTPNINRLALHHQTGHYSMLSQIKEGKSSDALLLIFNGLLPIQNGAAAMRYATNEYPSFVRYTKVETTQMFSASPPNVWNQNINSTSYGFDTLIAQKVSDISLSKKVINAIESTTSSFIFTAVTMASHSPFMDYADSSTLSIPETYYDEIKRRYLQCVHYTDSAIGPIIDKVMNDPVLSQNTRIIITGDHPIFALDIPIPFIIYDPFMMPVHTNRNLYQMDIYTTIIDRMHISTPWRGLGKNIADSCEYTPEQIKELEKLSDRMIRTNYFGKAELDR